MAKTKKKNPSPKKKPIRKASVKNIQEALIPKRIRDEIGNAKATYFEKVCAYVIESPYFPPFGVKKTANAWWLSVGKVMRLLDAFRNDATVLEACVEAGISRDQYYYFEEAHPDFSYIKEVLSELPNMYAKKIWLKGMKNDPKLAADWLKNRQNERFNTKQSIESGINDAFKGNAIINISPFTAAEVKKKNGNGH